MSRYWDACLFLDYFDASPRGIAVVKPFVDEARRRGERILTSSLSLTEVAFTKLEAEAQQLDPVVEPALDALFFDSDLVQLIPFDEDIALLARRLVRQTVPQPSRLKPIDAIHLASARFAGAEMIWTFDQKLINRAAELVDIPAMIPQPPMPPEAQSQREP